jgi:hypothetical protein
MRTFGVLCGFWSTNVGNAFFQLAAQHILQKLFPEDKAMMLADLSGYAFPKKGNHPNSFEMVAEMKMDYVVVIGPFLRREFHTILRPVLEKLAKKGTRIVCLGIGMMQYDDQTTRECKEVLKSLPIDVFTTRDTPTFEKYHDVCSNTFDGVDLAFYLPDLWDNSIYLDIEPYIVMNFDQVPEPKLVEVASGEPLIQLGGATYTLEFQESRRKLAEKNVALQIVERMFASGGVPDNVGPYRILRTDHRYNPILPKKVFAYPSTMSLDIPWPYMAIYASTQATLSNRVHACVATLSFGNPAMLVTKSPRAFLLDRVGAQDIKKGLVKIDMDKLKADKLALEAFIQKSLS